MKVALVQLRIEPTEIGANLDRAVEAVSQAAEDGADLVALPELFTVGYFAFDSYARTAEPLGGPALARLRETAVTEGVAVLAGTVVEDLAATAEETNAPTPSSEGLANTSVLFDADGNRRLVYRKRHLFGYDSAESDLLTPGERLPTATVDGVTLGVSTCYDLRFPELYRALVDRGVELVVVPSAWPYPRVEHWRLLPRARAVENLAYVAAVNGVAEFEDDALVGRSTVYDPWGTAIAGTGDSPDIVTASVEPERVETLRGEFPALADRR